MIERSRFNRTTAMLSANSRPAYHLCRPVPFMQAVRSALISRGLAPRDIQYEVFGPDLWHADYE
jgi:ferredoxin-NADP reductase